MQFNFCKAKALLCLLLTVTIVYNDLRAQYLGGRISQKKVKTTICGVLQNGKQSLRLNYWDHSIPDDLKKLDEKNIIVPVKDGKFRYEFEINHPIYINVEQLYFSPAYPLLIEPGDSLDLRGGGNK